MAITNLRHSIEDESEADLLARTYDRIAWGFVYPADMDVEAFQTAIGGLAPAVARHLDSRAGEHLVAFVDEFEADATQYVQTLELEPTCPLYLGHYGFDEPSTCREIADADRNQYMVELAGIYEHYGFEVEGELPDFVPAMTEFLGLTVEHRGDPLRREFLELFLDLLPEMVRQFDAQGTAYRHLLRAIHRIAMVDLERELPGEASPSGGDD